MAIDWHTWIPDGTQLKYRKRDSENWTIGTVIDSRIYKRKGETLHVIALYNQSSITFSIDNSNNNGNQGTHVICFD